MRKTLVAAVLVWAAGLGWARAQDTGTATLPAPQADTTAVTPVTDEAMSSEAPMGGVPRPGCGPDGSGNDGCGPSGCARVNCGWVSGEYLLWYTRRAPLPPLATSGVMASGGVLGQSSTFTLFDGKEENEPHSGFRITLGYWLDDCQTSSVEASGFYLGRRAIKFGQGSSGTPLLARPYIDAATGAEASFPVAFPNVDRGVLLMSNHNLLYGMEANYLNCLCRQKAEHLNICGSCLCCYQVDWLLGFRYLNFHEGLDSFQASDFAANAALYPAAFAALAPLAGDIVTLSDGFAARTQFYGPQTGIDAVVYQGPFAMELRGKVAVGASDEILDVYGTTGIVTPGGATPLAQGGFLAPPAEVGHHHHTDIAVVPEITFNLGYRFSDCLAAYVGYNFLYWTSVARAGDQVSPTINTSQLPVFGGTAGAGSSASIKSSDLWVQGLNVGIEFTW